VQRVKYWLLILICGSVASADLGTKFRLERIPITRHYILGARVAPKTYSAFSLIVVTPTLAPFFTAIPALTPARNHEYLERVKRGESRAAHDAELLTLIELVRDPITGDIPESFRTFALQQKVAESQRYLRMAYEFSRSVYLSSGNFGDQLPPGIEADVRGILSGEQSLILVTEYLNPSKILQTISIGYEGEDGLLPLERRLLGKGLKEKLPRSAPKLSREPRPYFDTSQPHESFPLADELLSMYPIVEGAVGEIKLYAREATVPIPWGKMIRRMMIAQNHTRHSPFLGWGAELVRNERLRSAVFKKFCRLREKAYPDDEKDASAMRTLFTAFFQLQFGDLVQPIWLDRLYLEAVNEQSARAYRGYFDVNEQIGEEFEDPEVLVRNRDGSLQKARTRILGVNRSHFENTARLPTRWYAEDYPLGKVRIIENPYGSSDLTDSLCVQIISRHESLIGNAERNYRTLFD